MSKKLTKQEKRRRSQRRFILTEVFLLLLLTAGIGVWLRFGLVDFREIKAIATNRLSVFTEEKLSGYQTIAFFGVDNRTVGTYNEGRSDCIMVAAINNDTKEVRIASIYRDTFLDSGDGVLRKANYAYASGGPKAAVAMLNRNLDLDIQEYVAVDFVALVDAVDAVGGVDLEPQDALSGQVVADINGSMGEVAGLSGKAAIPVTEGQTHLDGVQATTFCRMRHVDNDFIRAQRQRRVLAQLVAKAKAANIAELNNLINAIFPEIVTSLSLPDVISLAAAYHSYELTETTGFPFDKRGAEYDGKGAVVVPTTLETNVAKLHLFLYDNDAYAPSNTLKHISDEIVTYTGFTENSTIDYGNYDTVDVFDGEVTVISDGE